MPNTFDEITIAWPTSADPEQAAQWYLDGMREAKAAAQLLGDKHSLVGVTVTWRRRTTRKTAEASAAPAPLPEAQTFAETAEGKIVATHTRHRAAAK